MIHINKMEYSVKQSFTKRGDMVKKPYLKIYTSKGELTFPLDPDGDNDYYIKKFQEIEKVSSSSCVNMSYDFSDD